MSNLVSLERGEQAAQRIDLQYIERKPTEPLGTHLFLHKPLYSFIPRILAREPPWWVLSRSHLGSEPRSSYKVRWVALCLCSQAAALPWAPRASLWCQFRNRWLSGAGPHFIQCLHSTKHVLFSLVTVKFSFSKWKCSFIEWKKISFQIHTIKAWIQTNLPLGDWSSVRGP